MNDSFDRNPNNSESPAKTMPDPRDLAGWQSYTGPYCRWMLDTGDPAPGPCKSRYIECTNPECPLSEPLGDGKKIKWKTRFCHPKQCRFFEF